MELGRGRSPQTPVGYDCPDRRNRQRSKHLKIRDNRALAVPFIRAFFYKFVGEIARIACQSLTWAGSKLWLQQERSVFGPPETICLCDQVRK